MISISTLIKRQNDEKAKHLPEKEIKPPLNKK